MNSACLTHQASRTLLGAAFCAFMLSVGVPASAAPASQNFTITTLSSSPDTVTAGDGLIRIDVPRVVPMSKVTVALNGTDVTMKFRRDNEARTLTGIVDGLRLGPNTLFVDSNGEGEGRPTAELTLVNHPKDGPVFSGLYQTPFVCEAAKFMVPVFGAVLDKQEPKARPPECSVPRRLHYFYRTTTGAFLPWPFEFDEERDVPLPAEQRVYPTGLTCLDREPAPTGCDLPYIVRMETGSANRGIYHIWVLHDPYDAQPNFYTRPKAWNERFLYWFGANCGGGWYHQGTTAGLTMTATSATPQRLVDFPLTRGYAVGISSLTVNGQNCNDVIAAEAMMMVKERMIETLGPPKFTLGMGFSGGAMQQHMIADNYPGLLDGIVPGASYPDMIFSGLRVNYDAALLDTYFKTASVGWTTEAKRAVTGFGDYATVTNPSGVPESIRTAAPRGFCPPELPPSSLYDPVTNPHGTRCDIFSAYVNVFGDDPATGFARRAIDNVGVQYGLAALNTGAITAAQFIDLNAKVGGLDVDGKVVAARSVADLVALRAAYQTGRVTSGGGGLASIPIIDYRAYSDKPFVFGDKKDTFLADHHLRFNSFSMRQRLINANGHADNHVILVERLLGPAGNPALYAPIQSGLLSWAAETMDRWLTLIAEDGSDRPRIAKIIDAKNALGVSDGCHEPTPLPRPFVIEGPEIVKASDCLDYYPVFSFPRGVAGEGIANDVIKCQLKPIDWSDYKIAEPADLALLQVELPRIFPTGVCDYSRPGVEQRPPLGTWLDYGTD